MGNGKDSRAKERRKELAKFTAGCQSVFERLSRCIRWEGFKDRHYPQSSLHHSLGIAALTAYCLEREKQAGKNNLDALLVLAHAQIHEFDEGGIGDVRYVFKHDPRIEFLYAMIEKEEALKQMERLGFAGPFLRRTYCLTEGSLEARFFDAMEKLDYVLYALFEYVEHANKSFISVFATQREMLKIYAEEFPSVGEIYDAELRDWIDGLIKCNEWALEESESRVRQPNENDLACLVAAVNDMIRRLVKQSADPEAKRRDLLRRVKRAMGAK